MKRTVKCLAFFVAALSLAIGSPAWAQTIGGESGSSAPLDAIQANCSNIRTALNRLHNNDAIVRVNTGQVYNNISSRLMARLNSRLALNKIDAAELVALTSRFEKGRNSFSMRYNEYESALSTLLKIDCKTQPTDFYSHLSLARSERLKLSSSVRELNDIIAEYGTKVEKIKERLK